MRSHLPFLFWLKYKLTCYDEIYVGTHSVMSDRGDIELFLTTELFVAVCVPSVYDIILYITKEKNIIE